VTCRTCGRDGIPGIRTEGAIDQSDGARPGIVYDCECGGRRVDPVDQVGQVDGPEMHQNGWTASRSPCTGDVDAR
jgi:hypothetical protein